jgi:hypothetical protein
MADLSRSQELRYKFTKKFPLLNFSFAANIIDHINIKLKNTISFKSNTVDDKNKNIKNVEDKFHLKHFFHFIDKIENKTPEKNELLVIYDTSDDDQRKESKTIDKNNKNLFYSLFIELIYPRMVGTNQVISKKRKRKT